MYRRYKHVVISSFVLTILPQISVARDWDISSLFSKHFSAKDYVGRWQEANKSTSTTPDNSVVELVGCQTTEAFSNGTELSNGVIILNIKSVGEKDTPPSTLDARLRTTVTSEWKIDHDKITSKIIASNVTIEDSHMKLDVEVPEKKRNEFEKDLKESADGFAKDMADRIKGDLLPGSTNEMQILSFDQKHIVGETKSSDGKITNRTFAKTERNDGVCDIVGETVKTNSIQNKGAEKDVASMSIKTTDKLNTGMTRARLQQSGRDRYVLNFFVYALELEQMFAKTMQDRAGMDLSPSGVLEEELGKFASKRIKLIGANGLSCKPIISSGGEDPNVASNAEITINYDCKGVTAPLRYDISKIFELQEPKARHTLITIQGLKTIPLEMTPKEANIELPLER